MRVAIIDLGTNSVRFDVHQIGAKNKVRLLHREKLMVRLGQGVFSEGKLNPEAMRRTIQAFVSFRKTTNEFRVDRIVAFGTAALREASDGRRLVQLIRDKSGIELRVITGQEEAKLIALGILSNERLPKGRFSLIDIGGGSTEISVCRGKKVAHSNSFSLGTARLQQVFLRASPPKPLNEAGEDPIDHLRNYIRSALLTKMLAERWPKSDKMIGSSGTVRALAKLTKKGKKTGAVERADLKKLVRVMSTMTTTELLGLPGMESKRVDMILAGAILLEECMAITGAKRVVATDFSLRDGILEEEKSAFDSPVKSPLASHLPILRERVTKLLSSVLHTETVTKTAEHLFDRLRSVHKLKDEWRAYLTAAGLLHDVGEGVSSTDHDGHSYYIAKYSDFAPLEKWESEFIARLCLYHRVGKPDIDGLFMKGDAVHGSKSNKDAKTKEKERKRAFMCLLSILRVADALDRNHRAQVSIAKIQVTPKKVILNIRAKRGSGDLELLRVEQKKQLFEQTFRRLLVVH